MNRSILHLLCILALPIAGCTVGPDYQAPQTPVPDHFGATTRPATEHVDFARWWTTFNDPLLNSLIDRAMAGNLDLKIAERESAKRGRSGTSSPRTAIQISIQRLIPSHADQ